MTGYKIYEPNLSLQALTYIHTNEAISVDKNAKYAI